MRVKHISLNNKIYKFTIGINNSLKYGCRLDNTIYERRYRLRVILIHAVAPIDITLMNSVETQFYSGGLHLKHFTFKLTSL